MDAEAVAHAEAARALDQQRAEVERVRGRAGTVLAAAAVVTSFFAGLVLKDGEGLHRLQWVAVGLFSFGAVAALLAQWPWKAWKWIPPSQELVRAYVDGDNQVDAPAMLIHVFPRRFTVQERIGQQVADTLNELMRPHGVSVSLDAEHLCTQMRGVREQRSRTATSFWRGVYEREPEPRQAFLQTATRSGS